LSEIRATKISDAAGTGPIDLHKQSAAKAWVNFDGTGTVAIRDSVNVASLTDHGAGDYSVNISNAFSAANYSVNLSSANAANGYVRDFTSAFTFSAGLYRHTHSENSTSTALDSSMLFSVAHGDLA
jgi:hypothetical protein